jgi:hypothetical protein
MRSQPSFAVACLLVWSAMVALDVQAQVPPPNDHFTNRIYISVVSNQAVEVTGDNSYATLETGEPVPISCDRSRRTVWWAVTAPSDGLLQVIAGGFSNNVAWAVFQGNSVTTLTQKGADCALPILLQVVSNQTYNIAVDGAFNKSGGLVLQVQFSPRPSNDSFYASALLEGTNFTISGTLSGATLEPNETGSGTGLSVWYSWTAPADGRVALGGVRGFNVYTGPSLDTLQPVPILPNFLALADTTYHIQVVEGAGGSPYGNFGMDFVFSQFAPARNDHFGDAIAPSGDVEITHATLEPGEPVHRGGAPSKSLWWKWQTPFTALSSVYDMGSLAGNVAYDVYQGDALRALTRVATATNITRFNSLAGRDYYICASVSADSVGDVRFTLLQGGRSTVPETIPGNVLQNPSFEGGLNSTMWQVAPTAGGYNNQSGGPDGTTSILLQSNASIAQAIGTVAAQNYRIRFAFAGASALRVFWNGEDLGTISGQAGWSWTNFVVTASAGSSLLCFSNAGAAVQLDGGSVASLNDPPVILAQPLDVSVPGGGSALFDVAAGGSEPLKYQWHFNGDVIQGAPLRVLLLQNISQDDAGLYSVVITNNVGAVTSITARLTVETPAAPTLVLQPQSDTAPENIYCVLSAAAVGTPPLHYQWFRDGIAIGSETNSRVIFASLQTSNAGSYFVRVTNQFGTTLSVSAILRVTNSFVGSGGMVNLANVTSSDVNAPVFDVDGVTMLSGGGYLAQLYAGPSSAALRPVGQPRVFSSTVPGRILPIAVTIPTVEAGSEAIVQVRAWQASKGASYEEARALGGKFGRSPLLMIMTPPPPPIGYPVNLAGLQSFRMKAGLPEFNAGRITIEPRNSFDSVLLTLQGESNSLYLIERTTNQFDWHPLNVVTNQSGTVLVEDLPAPKGQVLYRARLLD